MQTSWAGFGIPPDNCVSTDFFTPRQLRVTLQDPPAIATQVQLSATTHAVNLWVSQATILYALDQDPGPWAPPVTMTPVAVTSFRPGGVLIPGGWQQCVLPMDGLAHTLHLLSEESYTTVYLVLLEEAA
jgi:hypothetical protein